MEKQVRARTHSCRRDQLLNKAETQNKVSLSGGACSDYNKKKTIKTKQKKSTVNTKTQNVHEKIQYVC